MRTMNFEARLSEKRGQPGHTDYEIYPVVDGIADDPIAYGDSLQVTQFIANQLNRGLVEILRDDSNVTPEMVYELMGIKRSPRRDEAN